MISNLIQELKNNKSQVIKLITVICVAVLVHFIGWNKIIRTETFHAFNTVYNEFTVKIIQNIGSISDKNIEYHPILHTLTTDGKLTKLIMPIDAYKYFLAGFVLLGLVPIKQWKSSLNAIVFVLLFVALRAAIISYILLVYKNMLPNVMLVWLDPTIFIPMLVLSLYIVQHNNILNKLYNALNLRFSEILSISLSTLLLLLIIIPPLPRVLFTYIHSDFMPGIVSFILYFSKLFLGLMGKTAEVSGRLIYLDSNWVDLEYPCIGIGVFTLVAVLIFSIRDKFSFKLIYLSAFAVIYMVINGLRLGVLLLYIHNTYHQIGLDKLLLHNYATYFMYVVAFAGFALYWSRWLKRV
jgi:exosortase/archaeosortase family protein